MYGFLAAVQILTRLPSPLRREPHLDDLAAAVGWFPVVGAGLGLALVAIDAAARFALAPVVVDALLVAFLVVVTGAFHLDGLIDSIDGLTAGPDSTGRLAAMRLAAVGGPGALGACILLLADFAALTALSGAARPIALFLAPMCGRTAILFAYRLYPYGRAEPTLSWHLKASATTASALIGGLFAAVMCLVVGGLAGAALLALALLLMHAIATLSLHRLPGLTGDVYGATCELSQLAALLAAPFLLRP
jgi:adenosylcobinamide-GDP ribazoletransferase